MAALFAAHGLASCDNNNPPDGETATPARPPAEALLATEADGVSEAVAARVAARERSILASPTAAETGLLMKEWAGATDERKSEILTRLGASAAPEAWPLLVANAVSGEKDLRMTALDALAIHGGGDPSPAIRACLASDDAEIRALAATLLGRTVRDPAAWSAAAVDLSPDVRVAYHAAIADAPVDIRLQCARAALATSDPQLRREGAAVAGGTLSNSSVDMLIPLLADPAASEDAADGLFFLLGRYFKSASEAQQWWSNHRDGFTDDLVAK